MREGKPHRRARKPRSLLMRFIRALRSLEDHWLGDLIGALCLFAALWLGLMAGAVMQ